jgi:hypothetical protein
MGGAREGLRNVGVHTRAPIAFVRVCVRLRNADLCVSKRVNVC